MLLTKYTQRQAPYPPESTTAKCVGAVTWKLLCKMQGWDINDTKSGTPNSSHTVFFYIQFYTKHFSKTGKCTRSLEWMCGLQTPGINSNPLTKTRRFCWTVEKVCKLRHTKNCGRTLFPVCARRNKVTHLNKLTIRWTHFYFRHQCLSLPWRCFWRHLCINRIPQDYSRLWSQELLWAL